MEAIYEDRAGVLWIGTAEGGLSRFDRETGDLHPLQTRPWRSFNSLSHNEVKAIYEDRQGELWIGTSIGGLNRFDREAGYFTHYQHDRATPNSLSQNSRLVDPRRP